MFSFDTEEKRTFKIAPAGSHLACLYSIVDLGTHTEEWEGKKADRRKVRLTFELHGDDTILDDGSPMSVAMTYTASLGEKAKFREHIEGWRGSKYTNEELVKFDARKLLGRFCMLNVIHSTAKTGGKTYAKIASISGVPKALMASNPEPLNDLVYLSLDQFDPKIYSTLPDWMKDMISQTKEYRRATSVEQPKSSGGMEDFESDIPF